MQEDPTLKSATDKQLLNEIRNRLDSASNTTSPDVEYDDSIEASMGETDSPEEPAPELPDSDPNQRVVRTKSTADRVYLLDEEKMTRHWVTNPDVLASLGFTMADVTEVSDDEMMKYQQKQALYNVQKPKDASS